MTAGSSPRFGFRAWTTVGLLWFVAGLDYLTRVMLTTMHGSVVAAVPMSEARFGLLTSVFLWVYGACSPWAGFIADRFSRSRVITLSLVTWSLLTLLTGMSRSFPELLIMRALMGLSQACYLPAALALITEYHRGPTRSFAVGVHMTGIMFGLGVSGLGGWLAEHYTWHFAFTLVGTVGLVYSLAIGLFLRDAPREHLLDQPDAAIPPVQFGAALTSLFSRSGFIVALAFWGMMGFVTWAITGWMPTLVREHFHLDQGTAGFSTTGYLYTASLLGVLAGGAWADRWSRTRAAARIYVPLIGTCLAVPGVMLAVHTPVLSLALAGLVLYGFTRVFSDSNMMPILCLVSDSRYRATGYGVLNFLSCICGGLAIYAGGALRDAGWDFNRVIGYAALGMLLCASSLLLIRAEAPPPPPLPRSRTAVSPGGNE